MAKTADDVRREQIAREEAGYESRLRSEIEARLRDTPAEFQVVGISLPDTTLATIIDDYARRAFKVKLTPGGEGVRGAPWVDVEIDSE